MVMVHVERAGLFPKGSVESLIPCQIFEIVDQFICLWFEIDCDEGSLTIWVEVWLSGVNPTLFV